MPWNKFGFLKAHPVNVIARDDAGNDNPPF